MLKGKYEPKLEFPKGWGVQTKTMDIFWNNTICSCGAVLFEFFHNHYGNFTTFVQFISRQFG